MSAAVEGVVICDVSEASCKCSLPIGHAGPHECDPTICTGSWDFDAAGNFIAVRMPMAVTR